MLCQRSLNFLLRCDKGRSPDLRLEIIVRERNHRCLPKGYCSHMGKGFHKPRIARYNDPTLFTALVKDERIAFGLLIKVIMHTNIEPCGAKLLCKAKGSEIPIDKKPWLTRLFGQGSI